MRRRRGKRNLSLADVDGVWKVNEEMEEIRRVKLMEDDKEGG